MSQPRRRRRRRRRGTPSGSSTAQQKPQQQQQQQQGAATHADQSNQARSRRRGRRRRGTSSGQQPGSPASSEDLVRAIPKPRPETLTAPADGQSLEGIIGDLQSEYGVPQYPQEYRITIKVAEERERNTERAAPLDDVVAQRAQDSTAPGPVENGGPRREKAPAAPRVSATAETPIRRRRRRGRRRRGGGGGGGGNPSAS